MMKCDDAVRILDENDSDIAERVGAGVHVFFCSRCRETMSRLKSAGKALAAYSPYTLPKDFSEDVLLRISELSRHELQEEKSIPLYGWIFTGIMLIAGMFALTQSASHLWLRGRMGSDLEVPLNIAMGIIITIYAALFIGSHLEEFARRFRVKRRF